MQMSMDDIVLLRFRQEEGTSHGRIQSSKSKRYTPRVATMTFETPLQQTSVFLFLIRNILPGISPSWLTLSLDRAEQGSETLFDARLLIKSIPLQKRCLLAWQDEIIADLLVVYVKRNNWNRFLDIESTRLKRTEKKKTNESRLLRSFTIGQRKGTIKWRTSDQWNIHDIIRQT